MSSNYIYLIVLTVAMNVSYFVIMNYTYGHQYGPQIKWTILILGFLILNLILTFVINKAGLAFTMAFFNASSVLGMTLAGVYIFNEPVNWKVQVGVLLIMIAIGLLYSGKIDGENQQRNQQNQENKLATAGV